VTEWLKNIEKYAKENVYKFLVGNKSDLTENRVIQTEEASKFAEEHNLPYIETSAKDGINIDELFDESIDKFLKGINSNNEEKNIKLEEINKGQGACCSN
jgi:GTPase SAR1 family protein